MIAAVPATGARLCGCGSGLMMQCKVAILASMLLSGLPAWSADPTMGSAQTSNDDARRPLPLLPMMAAHQKRNMREHLEAVQEIVAALAANDFDAVQRSARQLGYSNEVAQICQHFGMASAAFTREALAFHHTADRIAVAARARNRSRVLAELSTTLRACRSCHANWKQEIVDEPTWNRLTSAVH